MADIGDREQLTLTVSPADGSTTAAASARLLPDGTPVTLDVLPDVDRSVWTAFLPITALGAWRITWTVTGTGAGVEYDTVYALGGPDPAAGQSYATLADLAMFTGSEPGPDAGRLLVKASRKVDLMLIGSVYDTDDDEMPTQPKVIAALRDATCAQVQYWDETGDTTGSNAAAGWRDVSIGKVRLSRTVGGSGNTAVAQEFAPTAIDILRVAGLLPVRAWVYG